MKHSRLASALVAAAATMTARAHDVTASFVEDGATSMCGKWDYVETGAYTVYQDLWNEGAGSGSQCTSIDSPIKADTDTATDADDSGSGEVVAWSTSWSWSGDPTQVKSYANAVTNLTVMHLADIGSIPTKWSWTYSASSSYSGPTPSSSDDADDNGYLFANVAYDTFTTSSPSAVEAGEDPDFEVMVWVATFGGVGPLSASGHALRTGVSLAGAAWDLWEGWNGATRVYSFVANATAGAAVTVGGGAGRWAGEFEGDLLVFFDFLADHEGLPRTQYLLSIHAGTESFAGEDAAFGVVGYSCGVSTGSAAAAGETSAVVKAAASSSVAVARDAAATPTTTSSARVKADDVVSPASTSSSSSSRSSVSRAAASLQSPSNPSSKTAAVIATAPNHEEPTSSSASPSAQTPAPSQPRPQEEGLLRVPGSSSASAAASAPSAPGAAALDSPSDSRRPGVGAASPSHPQGGKNNNNSSSVATHPAAAVGLTGHPAAPAVKLAEAATAGANATTPATSTAHKGCRVRRARRGGK